MDLKTFLVTRKFTQKEFAKHIGISSTALSNYLAGRRTPTLKIAKRIEEFTDGRVKMEEL